MKGKSWLMGHVVWKGEMERTGLLDENGAERALEWIKRIEKKGRKEV